jgi:hypothetical protein
MLLYATLKKIMVKKSLFERGFRRWSGITLPVYGNLILVANMLLTVDYLKIRPSNFTLELEIWNALYS